jgi:hypothetical protein
MARFAGEAARDRGKGDHQRATRDEHGAQRSKQVLAGDESVGSEQRHDEPRGTRCKQLPRTAAYGFVAMIVVNGTPVTLPRTAWVAPIWLATPAPCTRTASQMSP